MKKLLGIVVLVLLCLITYANNDYSEALTWEQILEDSSILDKKKMEKMGFFERQKYIYKKYKRRKAMCTEEAKSAETDYAAKRIYKACMD